MTEPGRVAVILLAFKVLEEKKRCRHGVMGVGYSIRFEERFSRQHTTSIKFLMEGVLRREFLSQFLELVLEEVCD